MLRDDQLRQRANALRRELTENIQNTRDFVQQSRDLIAASERRRESELAACFARSEAQMRSSEVVLAGPSAGGPG